MRCSTTSFAAACLVACSSAAVLAAPQTSPIKVTGGEIAGSQAGAVRTWLGIPFAAPPVGPLRWKAPQPVVPWQGVRDARSFGAACAQVTSWVSEPKSEDCLFLNVWAPARAEKLPVLVWIHGGGYFGGTGAQPLYDGSNLASHGAVVVTLNYRLGIFGFFAHPELTAESPDGASGNQGILDQIAALRWVKQNIAAFGGDPERVTIMGESAGANSVAVLVASPLARGLFQRAIAQSGNFGMPIDRSEEARFDRGAAEKRGVDAAQSVGARSLAELRALSVPALQKAAWQARTFVDGHVLQDDLVTIYRRHRQNDVPILVGWNAEEGKDLAPELLRTSTFTATRHRDLVAKLLDHAPSEAMLAAYPGTTDAQARASIDRLTTDWWGWRMVHWAGLQARHGRSHPYVYFFAHRPAEPSTPCTYGCGAGHGAEIRYVFDNLGQDRRAWTGEDRELAARLAKTWVNFASTGDPNGPGLPAWPVFDGTNATILRIGDDGPSALPDLSIFTQGR